MFQGIFQANKHNYNSYPTIIYYICEEEKIISVPWKIERQKNQANYLDNTALSEPADNPVSKIFCPFGTPGKNPFFFAVGSVLDRMLEMEKLVEPLEVFCVVVAFASLSPRSSSSPVLITGKHVVMPEPWPSSR